MLKIFHHFFVSNFRSGLFGYSLSKLLHVYSAVFRYICLNYDTGIEKTENIFIMGMHA